MDVKVKIQLFSGDRTLQIVHVGNYTYHPYAMRVIMNPVDTAPLVAKVADAGALNAFMLLVIFGLAFAVYVLYKRNVALGDMYHTDSINTVNALNSIAHQMEIANAK